MTYIATIVVMFLANDMLDKLVTIVTGINSALVYATVILDAVGGM